VIEQSFQKVFCDVKDGGFDFVSHFLSQKCASETFTCYEMTPEGLGGVLGMMGLSINSYLVYTK